MSVVAILTIVSTYICIAVGLLVFLRDPNRTSNTIFLVLSLSLAFWGFIEFGMLLASGYSRGELVDRLISQGASWFIEKPFELQRLSEKLAEVLH